MASTSAKVLGNIMAAPLPEMVERLGFAIASAQLAMDQNSIAIANAMALTNVGIVDREFNLIELGFTPTFYAFTEATIHVKMEFAMMEGEGFTIGGSLNLDFNSNANSNSNSSNSSNSDTQTVAFGISINAQYSRKYEVNVEASSSITARMVSLPPPDRLKELLNEVAAEAAVPLESIQIQVPGGEANLVEDDEIQLIVSLLPSNATNKAIVWSSEPSATISGGYALSATGLLVISTNSSGTLKVIATSLANSLIKAEYDFTINQA